MKLPPRTIYVDRFGNTSENKSLYDYNDDKLIDCMNNTWSKDIHDLAKEILKERKEKLLKLKL